MAVAKDFLLCHINFAHWTIGSMIRSSLQVENYHLMLQSNQQEIHEAKLQLAG